MNDALRQSDPARWLSEMLRQQEIDHLNTNKTIVRNLLIKHGAEDLIPMLLEDE
jgi:hypothetical protein